MITNPNFVQSPIAPEILEAVNNYNDSTVSSYSLDAELVTGSLKDLADITVEQFLALTSSDITGGIINSASIADTAANILFLDPSTIGESGSVLDKITGVSVTEATVDQALSIQLGIEYMNDNGGNVGANFSYTFASGETFTDVTLAGAEIALNGINPPSVGTITIRDFGEFLLEGEALLKTGGSLDGVGSVTAVDVNADSIVDVVAKGYIDTVIIDLNEITGPSKCIESHFH